MFNTCPPVTQHVVCQWRHGCRLNINFLRCPADHILRHCCSYSISTAQHWVSIYITCELFEIIQEFAVDIPVMMESTKAGLKAWLLSIFSMELPFICLWMHSWHILLWKHSSPFAPGRWYLDYVLPLSHTLVSEHAHAGNAQHDSKVSWLDSRCSTDCPTGNVLIILPNFTLVVSTHWSSTRPTISVLAISRLNLSFCAWPEFPPFINYQPMNNPSASTNWLHTASLLYPNCSLGTPNGLWQTSQGL